MSRKIHWFRWVAVVSNCLVLGLAALSLAVVWQVSSIQKWGHVTAEWDDTGCFRVYNYDTVRLVGDSAPADRVLYDVSPIAVVIRSGGPVTGTSVQVRSPVLAAGPLLLWAYAFASLLRRAWPTPGNGNDGGAGRMGLSRPTAMVSAGHLGTTSLSPGPDCLRQPGVDTAASPDVEIPYATVRKPERNIGLVLLDVVAHVCFWLLPGLASVLAQRLLGEVGWWGCYPTAGVSVRIAMATQVLLGWVLLRWSLFRLAAYAAVGTILFFWLVGILLSQLLTGR